MTHHESVRGTPVPPPYAIHHAHHTELALTYNPLFLDVFKREVPSNFRRYDPVTKTWTVFHPYRTPATILASKFFPKMRVEGTINRHEPTASERARAQRERDAEDQRKRDEAMRDYRRKRDDAERRAKQEQEEAARYARRNRGQDEHRGFDWDEFVRQAGQTPPPPPPPNGHAGPRASSDHDTLGVAANAPVEVIDAAYRALSKKYHPDKGGDPEKMKTINAAYSRLKARF